MKKKKAVFLDRDGTLIRQIALPHRLKQIRLMPHAAVATATLHRLGFLVIVITNQPVVARGLITSTGMDRLHTMIMNRLQKGGGHLDAVYYCPHHPHADVVAYRRHCRCRKPGIGLIERAEKDFFIDRRKSFLVGDTTVDMRTGQRADIRSILVKTGYGGNDGIYAVTPLAIVKDIAAAATFISRHD
jgi:histidinol-phosphate phosphatase family protein